MSDTHSFDTYKFPFIKVVEFKFEQGKSNIIYKRFIWSGKEELFIDGQLISKKYSFRWVSNLIFKLNNIPYELEFKYINYSTGEMQCSLIQDNTHIKTINKKPQKGSWKSIAALFLASYSVFFIVGFALAFLHDVLW